MVDYRNILEQTCWGDPPGDVTLTASERMLRHLGETLFAGESTSGFGTPPTADERRERVIEITAGASILDQLEAVAR